MIFISLLIDNKITWLKMLLINYHSCRCWCYHQQRRKILCQSKRGYFTIYKVYN
jgi:hypothetical protein